MTAYFDLMVAPNGARLGKQDHPALPITASEIAQTAYACAQAGATSIHVHVRDDQGGHSLDPERYETVLQRIKKKSRIAVQISTESAGLYDVATQRRLLTQTSARDASVSLREIARDPAGFAETYRMAAQRGIDIQHILYAPDEVARLLNHFDNGEIPTQSRRAIFVLGRYTANQTSTPKDLDPFLKQLGPDHLQWSVCAFGQNEQACLLAALDHGGHVRIGFENNRLAPDGTIFPDNAASVAAFVQAADRAGFTPGKIAA